MSDKQTDLKQFQLVEQKKNWNSAKKKKPEKNKVKNYLRRCKRCKKTYNATRKFSKICTECAIMPYSKRWKNENMP